MGTFGGFEKSQSLRVVISATRSVAQQRRKYCDLKLEALVGNFESPGNLGLISTKMYYLSEL